MKGAGNGRPFTCSPNERKRPLAAYSKNTNAGLSKNKSPCICCKCLDLSSSCNFTISNYTTATEEDCSCKSCSCSDTSTNFSQYSCKCDKCICLDCPEKAAALFKKFTAPIGDADNFKNGTVICHCLQCKCLVCPVQKKEVQINEKAGICPYAPCPDLKMSAGEKSAAGDNSKKICKCSQCVCQNCFDSSKKDSCKCQNCDCLSCVYGDKETTSKIKPKNIVPCDCLTCGCDPCADSEKQKQIEEMKKKKDYELDDCQCTFCSDLSKIKPDFFKIPIPCDCLECGCNPCADNEKRKQMDDIKEKENYQKMKNGKGDDCQCDPNDCKCETCPDTTKEKQKQQNVQDNKSSSQKNISDCKCEPCDDLSKTKNNMKLNSICSNDDCNCQPCLDPTKKLKNNQTAKSTKDVKYVEANCQCEPCPDPDINSKKLPVKSEIQCTNDDCTCEPCLDPSKTSKNQQTEAAKVEKLKQVDDTCQCDPCPDSNVNSIKSQVGNEVQCTNDDCTCEPCLDPFKKRKNQQTEAAKVEKLKQVDDTCQCDPCPDSNVNSTKSQVGNEVQCTNDDCTCEPCLDPFKKRKNQQTEAAKVEKLKQVDDTCQCDPCPDSNVNSTKSQVGNEVQCTNDDCTCEPCLDPFKKRKNQQTEAAKVEKLKQVDEICQCDPCPDPNKETRKVTSEKGVQESQRIPCNCSTCSCNPCNDPNVVNKTKNSKDPNQENGDNCYCSKCICNPCPVSSQGDSGKDRKMDCFCSKCDCKVPENTKADSGCSCANCTCESDANKMKNKKKPTNCFCPICNCNPCIDSKGKRDLSKQLQNACNCPVCSCRPCADPNVKAKTNSCICIKCDCDEVIGEADKIAPVALDKTCKCEPCYCEDSNCEKQQTIAKTNSCYCVNCTCISSDPKDTPKKENEQQRIQKQTATHSVSCYCTKCQCDPSEYEKGEFLRKEALPCICDTCKCITCTDNKNEEDSNVLQQTQQQAKTHATSCYCTKCQCDPTEYGKGEFRKIDAVLCVCDTCTCITCTEKKNKGDSNVMLLSQKRDKCYCIKCQCDPAEYATVKFVKKEAEPCTCDTCKCITCVDDKNRGDSPKNEIMTKRIPCNCIKCECLSCNDKNDAEGTTKLMTKRIPCNCKKCECLSCNDKNKAEGNCEGKELSDLNPNCKCETCICADCDENFAQPPKNCECGSCICNGCDFLTNIADKSTHDRDCICTDCLCGEVLNTSTINLSTKDACICIKKQTATGVSRKCSCLDEKQKQGSEEQSDKCKCESCLCVDCKYRPKEISVENKNEQLLLCKCDACLCVDCKYQPKEISVENKNEQLLLCKCESCLCVDCKYRPKEISVQNKNEQLVCECVVPCSCIDCINKKQNDTCQCKSINKTNMPILNFRCTCVNLPVGQLNDKIIDGKGISSTTKQNKSEYEGKSPVCSTNSNVTGGGKGDRPNAYHCRGFVDKSNFHKSGGDRESLKVKSDGSKNIKVESLYHCIPERRIEPPSPRKKSKKRSNAAYTDPPTKVKEPVQSESVLPFPKRNQSIRVISDQINRSKAREPNVHRSSETGEILAMEKCKYKEQIRVIKRALKKIKNRSCIEKQESPFKKTSDFIQTISELGVAFSYLKQNCRANDKVIKAMTEELKRYTSSTTFVNVFNYCDNEDSNSSIKTDDRQLAISSCAFYNPLRVSVPTIPAFQQEKISVRPASATPGQHRSGQICHCPVCAGPNSDVFCHSGDTIHSRRSKLVRTVNYEHSSHVSNKSYATRSCKKQESDYRPHYWSPHEQSVDCARMENGKMSYDSKIGDSLSYEYSEYGQCNIPRPKIFHRPLVKKASIFGQTVSDLRIAITTLQAKCKAKDKIIEEATKKLKQHISSKAILGVLNTDIEEAPDYDRYDPVEDFKVKTTIKKTDTHNCCQTKIKGVVPCKCGKYHTNNKHVNLTGFRVINIKRITVDSVIIEWKAPKSKAVIGYEIEINGKYKTKILSGWRTCAMVHSVDLSSALNISIFAVTECGRCQLPAKAIYEIRKT